MNTVGVFDSGIGGLSVAALLRRLKPDVNIIYYADTEHVPYGNKDEATIRAYMDDVSRYFIEKNVDAILLACNTATSAAVKALRNAYDLPIIGMEPAVKPASRIDAEAEKKIIITATDLTLRLEKLSDLISRLHVEDRIERLSLQKLVTYAEQGQFDTPEVRRYLAGQFQGINFDRVSALVLGCTHFIFYKPMLAAMLPEHVSLVDGNLGTVQRVISLLPPVASDPEEGQISFVVSQAPATAEQRVFFEAVLARAELIYKSNRES